MKDYYSILGVSGNATMKEIAISYKKRLKIVHPDRFNAKTNPDEWQQANRMLQELNEAYAYLKKHHPINRDSKQQDDYNGTSQEYQARNDTSSSQAYSEYTQAEMYPAKGLTICSIKKLSMNHRQFIKSLIANKNHVVKIAKYNLFMNYAGLIIAGYFYIMNVQNWMKLSIVVVENYWLGMILLLILGTLIARCSIVILGYHVARIKPCIMFTPMYYIRVKHDQIAFAYMWEIESFNFQREKFLSYFSIKVGNYFDKFYIPITFSFDRFKHDLSKIDQIRSSIKDPLAWLRTNDILRDVVSEPVKRYPIISIIVYLSSLAVTIAVGIMLSNSFTIVDSSVPAKARIENYAAKEALRPAIEIRPSVEPPSIVLPPKIEKAFDKPPKPLPLSGKQYYYSSGEDIAPLEILVPDHGEHYFIKLVNAYNNQNVRAVFVRSGGRVEIEVPLGTYKIKYASGQTWYGREYLFGPNTHVSMAESDFEFKIDGYQVLGHTIELIKQTDGNLSTRDISLDEF